MQIESKQGYGTREVGVLPGTTLIPPEAAGSSNGSTPSRSANGIGTFFFFSFFFPPSTPSPVPVPVPSPGPIPPENFTDDDDGITYEYLTPFSYPCPYPVSTFEASVPRCRIFRIPSPATDVHGNVIEEPPYTFTRRARAVKQRKIKEKRRRTLLKMNPQFDQLPSQAMSPGQGLGRGLGLGGGMSHAFATVARRDGGLTVAAFTTDGLKGHLHEEAGRRSRPTSRASSPRQQPQPQPQGGEVDVGWEEEEEDWGSDNDAYDDSEDDDDDENDEDYGSEVGEGARGDGTLMTQVSVDDSQALYWHGPTHPLTHIKNERKRGRAGRTIDIQRVTAKVGTITNSLQSCHTLSILCDFNNVLLS